MQMFVKITTLNNISGRADYISDKKNGERSEKVVIKSEDVNWKPYIEYEKQNRKTYKENNEGRELIIALPNDWDKLNRNILRERAQQIAEKAIGKNTDMQWAIHWNEKKTNLHLHVVFSERKKSNEEFTICNRDIYHTSDGKVARAKKDRARDADGNILPPIYYKGEIRGGFTPKDKKYKARDWKYELKEMLAVEFERYGATIEPKEPLNQYHEGKGKEAPIIREKNEAIKISNQLFPIYKAYYPQFNANKLKKTMLEQIKASKILIIYRDPRDISNNIKFAAIPVLKWKETPQEYLNVINMSDTQLPLKKNEPEPPTVTEPTVNHSPSAERSKMSELKIPMVSYKEGEIINYFASTTMDAPPKSTVPTADVPTADRRSSAPTMSRPSKPIQEVPKTLEPKPTVETVDPRFNIWRGKLKKIKFLTDKIDELNAQKFGLFDFFSPSERNKKKERDIIVSTLKAEREEIYWELRKINELNIPFSQYLLSSEIQNIIDIGNENIDRLEQDSLDKRKTGHSSDEINLIIDKIQAQKELERNKDRPRRKSKGWDISD